MPRKTSHHLADGELDAQGKERFTLVGYFLARKKKYAGLGVAVMIQTPLAKNQLT
ncbi:MAG: hypothetical protein MPJ50_00120 [Pirellulales bacterium]|nr:hypothetical protein [Pirellulales bacterium]